MLLSRRKNSAWAEARPQRLASRDAFVARVASVPDGDTLRLDCVEERDDLANVEFVRLAGIDAPELRGPDRVNAQRSQQALARLVLARFVTVRPQRIWRDPYNRIIASVTVDGWDVGSCLIRSGHAKTRIVTKPIQHR